MSMYSTGRHEPSSFALEVACGNVEGISSINKFGFNLNCDNGILTDIWDLTTQPIWLPPTQSRIHAIVSSDDTDGKTGSPNSAGARTIHVHGLTDWNTKEVEETVILNGTTAVNTANSYVIIHRMRVRTSGASNINKGIIKATAATDNTITAQIDADDGQTEMAIFGIPSVQKAYMADYYASMLRSAGGASNVVADVSLLWTPDVENQNKMYQIRSRIVASMRGVSSFEHTFNPYAEFPGPGILKIQVNTDTDDMGVSAGFDLYLVDN